MEGQIRKGVRNNSKWTSTECVRATLRNSWRKQQRVGWHTPWTRARKLPQHARTQREKERDKVAWKHRHAQTKTTEDILRRAEKTESIEKALSFATVDTVSVKRRLMKQGSSSKPKTQTLANSTRIPEQRFHIVRTSLAVHGSLSTLDVPALQSTAASANPPTNVCSLVDCWALLWRCAKTRSPMTFLIPSKSLMASWYFVPTSFRSCHLFCNFLPLGQHP